MSLTNRIADWFGQGEFEREKPDPPEDESLERQMSLDVYETTVEYRNGDTETFKNYGRSKTGKHVVTYKTEPTPHSVGGMTPRMHYDTRSFNYEVLSREPEDELIAGETWELTWTKTWKEDTWFDGTFKEWTEANEGVTAERKT